MTTDDAAFLVGAAAALAALLLRPVRPPAGAIEEAPIGAAPAQETA